MDLLKHINSEGHRGLLLLIICLLTPLLLPALQPTADTTRLQATDLTTQNNLDDDIYNGETVNSLLASGYTHSSIRLHHQPDHNKLFSTAGEQSLPPVDLQSDNEPVGEDERKSQQKLFVPCTDIDSRLNTLKYGALDPGRFAPSIALALRHLSTVVLLY